MGNIYTVKIIITCSITNPSSDKDENFKIINIFKIKMRV